MHCFATAVIVLKPFYCGRHIGLTMQYDLSSGASAVTDDLDSEQALIPQG